MAMLTDGFILREFERINAWRVGVSLDGQEFYWTFKTLSLLRSWGRPSLQLL